jgi:hypothetical protein
MLSKSHKGRWRFGAFLAAVALASIVSLAVARDAHAIYCDVEIRSCASDDPPPGDMGGGGAPPRPAYYINQEIIVPPGAPGWNCNYPATCRRCDSDFKYWGLPFAWNASGQVVMLRIVRIESRSWWDQLWGIC